MEESESGLDVGKLWTVNVRLSVTAELKIDTGKWCGLHRDERACKNLDNGEVEDVEMFIVCIL